MLCMYWESRFNVDPVFLPSCNTKYFRHYRVCFFQIKSMVKKTHESSNHSKRFWDWHFNTESLAQTYQFSYNSSLSTFNEMHQFALRKSNSSFARSKHLCFNLIHKTCFICRTSLVPGFGKTFPHFYLEKHHHY